MRHNFAQTLPFPKKDNDFNQNISDQLRRANKTLLDQTTKKNSFYANQSTLKTQITSSYKACTYINDQETQQKLISSYRSIQNSNKINKFNPFTAKEKKQQPPNLQRSPPKPNMAYSPNNLKQSKTMKEVPIRATLKTLLQTRGLTSFDCSFQKKQSRVQSPNMKLNSSISESLCNGDGEGGWANSMRILQKQNKILKEQNQFLKCQMNQIKKHLMSANTYKKEETISNLRDTIKKEDNQIKELRTKLQISNKKVSTFNTLLKNKDEEIQFLNNKIMKLEEEILELKQINAEKIEHLKQKMAIVLKSYSQLQLKFKTEQEEWASFIDKWNQEKSMYTHRINFLQTYISNNH